MTTSHSDAIDYSDAPPMIEEEKFDHVMLDIETLSLHPHRALILSIGMVEFDPVPRQSPRIGERQLLVLDPVEQVILGRKVDEGTQKFWRDEIEKHTGAADHWRYAEKKCTAAFACSSVADFVKGHTRVWANGTQFDLSNILGLAEDVGIASKDMWFYRAPRDMRTFCEENPQRRILEIGKAIDLSGMVKHEPVCDCLYQIHHVWQHWQDA